MKRIFEILTWNDFGAISPKMVISEIEFFKLPLVERKHLALVIKVVYVSTDTYVKSESNIFDLGSFLGQKRDF